MNLQADLNRRTMHEGARQYAHSMLWGMPGDKETAEQFADWYTQNEIRWTFCVAWNYWWTEVAL